MQGDYPPIDYEVVLRDSGLFTQVEPEYLASSVGTVHYISRKRGAMVSVHRDKGSTEIPAQLFIDHMGDTYQSHGWYSADEMRNLVLPVMKSDEAWSFFIRAENDYQMDFSLASEKVR